MEEFKAFEVIVDRYGKEHKIFPALLKDFAEIRHLTMKFNDQAMLANILQPKFEEDGTLVKTEDGDIEYDNSAIEAMLEIIVMALNGKESREQIDKWLDFKIARRIIEIYYDISHLKKNEVTI